MNRRDIIILAVLLNAGLLAILFMMTLNIEDEPIQEKVEFREAVVDNVPAPSMSTKENPIVADNQGQPVDEIDTVLKNLDDTIPAETIIVDEEVSETSGNKVAQIKQEEPQPKKGEIAASGSDNYIEITVKKGDSLDKIARANGTTIQAIKKINTLTTDKLKIGQVLRIPVAEKEKSVVVNKTVAPKKSPEANPIASSDSEYYTVKSGDNPWKIAKKFDLKVDDLLKLNNLDEEKARNLKVGDKIRVK